MARTADNERAQITLNFEGVANGFPYEGSFASAALLAYHEAKRHGLGKVTDLGLTVQGGIVQLREDGKTTELVKPQISRKDYDLLKKEGGIISEALYWAYSMLGMIT